MAFRPIGADRLAVALQLLQPADHARADDQRQEEGEQDRAAAPERQVAEQVEDAEVFGQRCEQIVEHASSSRSRSGRSRLSAALMH